MNVFQKLYDGEKSSQIEGWISKWAARNRLSDKCGYKHGEAVGEAGLTGKERRSLIAALA